MLAPDGETPVGAGKPLYGRGNPYTGGETPIRAGKPRPYAPQLTGCKIPLPLLANSSIVCKESSWVVIACNIAKGRVK